MMITKENFDKDGINLTFNIMKKFDTDNQDIQSIGLGLLANLASYHSNNKQDICYKDGINFSN